MKDDDYTNEIQKVMPEAVHLNTVTAPAEKDASPDDNAQDNSAADGAKNSTCNDKNAVFATSTKETKAVSGEKHITLTSATGNVSVKSLDPTKNVA